MTKSIYITRKVWYSIDKDFRDEILSVLGKRVKDIVSAGVYVAEIEDRLRMSGEHRLADCLLSELDDAEKEI